LRFFSFGGYGLALAALALVVFGAIECPPAASGSQATDEGTNKDFFRGSIVKAVKRSYFS